MGQLAAGIAHDFNNILTPMIGYADLLMLRPELPEEIRSKLEIISRQGRRAEQLVRQVLDFSRQRSTQRKPIDIGSLVAESVSLFRQSLHEDIEILYTPPDEPRVVLSNASQIGEIITNLVINARDVLPDGGRITLSVDRHEIEDDESLDVRVVAGCRPTTWWRMGWYQRDRHRYGYASRCPRSSVRAVFYDKG